MTEISTLKKLAEKYKIDTTGRTTKKLLQDLLSRCNRISRQDMGMLVGHTYKKNEVCEFLKLRIENNHSPSLIAEGAAHTIPMKNLDLGKDDSIDRYMALSLQNPYKKIKQLAEGVQGKVFQMRVGNLDFARKISKSLLPAKIKNPEHLFDSVRAFQNEMIIEMAVATLLTECRIKQICPHFPLTYGIHIQDRQLQIDMQLLRGMTLKKWSQSPRSNEEWYSIIFQILISLYCMQKHFGFVHDDLHSSNIIVERCAKDTIHHYICEGQSYYVPLLGNMLYIIDFGRVFTPDNVMEIPWHVQLRQKEDRKKGQNVYHFDYQWLLESILQSNNAKIVKKLNEMLFFSILEVELDPLDVLSTFFSKEIHQRKECGNFPCFDVKPRGAKISEPFDVSKRLDKRDVPKNLRKFVQS